jgi:hypothetical protein
MNYTERQNFDIKLPVDNIIISSFFSPLNEIIVNYGLKTKMQTITIINIVDYKVNKSTRLIIVFCNNDREIYYYCNIYTFPLIMSHQCCSKLKLNNKTCAYMYYTCLVFCLHVSHMFCILFTCITHVFYFVYMYHTCFVVWPS